jgi:hypothetical protein
MKKNEVTSFDGKPFIVTIDRNRMERRYVLQTRNEDGTHTPRNEPMFGEEFRAHYGFDETWPHKSTIRHNDNHTGHQHAD